MRKLMAVMGVLALVALAPAQKAAEKPLAPGEDGHVVMDWKKFQEVTKWDAGAAAAADKDKFVIPWAEVQTLFNIKIQNVNTAELKLPWREFKMLLEWSVSEAERKRQEANKEPPPPVPFLIQSAEYLGTELSKEGAHFKATFKIEVLEEKGWQKINVLPGTVAVSQAKLPAGVHLQLENNNYLLLTKTKGTIDAEIEFSVAVKEEAGQNTLSFAKVPSSTCVLDVTVPEKDVEVNVPTAQSKLVKAVAEGTRVVAALPSAAQVSVSWEQAIPEAEKVPPKLYSETRTLISVADGLLLGQTQVAVNILHTATRQLTLNVPQGVSVLEVTCRDLRDWRVGAQGLTIQFAREVIGPEVIEVVYEMPLADKLGQSGVPVITVDGVEREKGYIAVVALTNVEIKGLPPEGAHQVDVKSLPAEIMAMTNQPVLLGYRYVVPEFKVALEISKHEDVDILLTVVDRAHFTVMQTFDGRRITKAIYNVRNNRNQFLRLKMPAGAELWSASVAGKATQPAKDAEERILLPLVRSGGQSGMSAFPVEIVYVEQGTPPDVKGRGVATVELPTCSEPITHLMVSLYVPKEGKYYDFEGSLREVERFSVIGGRTAVVVNADQQAQQLQQDAVATNAAAVRAGGAAPITVDLPITGKVFLFEKILVVEDAQTLTYTFSGLKK